MADQLTGVILGDFEIGLPIGKGGMGVVYEAMDLRLRRPVALKLLAPELLDDTTARARFQREIKSAVAIEHPHVVPVYSAGYEDGFFYLAMRYVRGPDLGRIVGEGPLPEPRAMRLIGQIASALYDVHEHGLVHRDVKPSNVLVWHAGDADEHCFLTDFGIAKALHDTGRITNMGNPGTPGYMAPELRNGASATAACDQYSLAIVLFELLTGELPYELDEDGLEDLTRVRPLAFYAPGVSARVKATIERALSEDPGDRFPDIRAFVMSDETAHESFERSQEITDTVNHVQSEADLVHRLVTDHGLSQAAVAEIAGLDESRVALLERRAAARRSLMGD